MSDVEVEVESQKMEHENLEEFLTPITPTKQPNRQQLVYSSHTQQHQPESPSKAQARNRLGSLLGQIRKSDGRDRLHPYDGDGMDARSTEDAYDEDYARRGPGRPKKIRREKRVVFELRGKPFGLRDSGRPETIYALCRKWMYGKDDELESEQMEEADMDIPRFNKSLDLMATRDIHVLPPPRHDVPLMDPRPQKVMLAPKGLGEAVLDNPIQLLGEHKNHWKNVKKNWVAYNRKRQQRYADSLQLLRTVHGIAQQTQI